MIKPNFDKVGQLMLSPIQPFMGVLIGIATFVWGAWVATPAWSAFSRGEQYDLLASLADEPVWGGIAIVLGAILITACWSLKVETIRLASLANFYFWGLIAMSYAYSDWRHLALIPAVYFSLTAGYAYLNLTVRTKRGMTDGIFTEK